MDQAELLWRHYSQYVDLYKHYLKIVLELNAFYYGITGAIVSYYFAHTVQPLMRWSLALPILMSVLLGSLMLWGAVLMVPMRRDIYAIREALKLYSAPEVGLLTALLAISAVMFLMVAGGLTYVFFQ